MTNQPTNATAGVNAGGGERTSREPIRLTGEEIAIRRAAKAKIAAKYGFENWNDAPVEALREYQRFLQSRTGDTNTRGETNGH